MSVYSSPFAVVEVLKIRTFKIKQWFVWDMRADELWSGSGVKPPNPLMSTCNINVIIIASSLKMPPPPHTHKLWSYKRCLNYIISDNFIIGQKHCFISGFLLSTVRMDAWIQEGNTASLPELLPPPHPSSDEFDHLYVFIKGSKVEEENHTTRDCQDSLPDSWNLTTNC